MLLILSIYTETFNYGVLVFYNARMPECHPFKEDPYFYNLICLIFCLVLGRKPIRKEIHFLVGIYT